MGKKIENKELNSINSNSDHEHLTENKTLATKSSVENAEQSVKNLEKKEDNKLEHKEQQKSDSLEKQNRLLNRKNYKRNNQIKKFANDEQTIFSKSKKERRNSCGYLNVNGKRKMFNRFKKSHSLSKDYQHTHLNKNEVDYKNYNKQEKEFTIDFCEPFSDSDNETFGQTLQKPSLNVPRGRIRTLSGTVPPIGYSPKWGGATMCLCCLQFFDLPDEITKFAAHLLDAHHIVIKDVDYIVDPKRYIEYWRQRFAKESVDKIIPIIHPDKDSIYYGKVDYYYEMSECISEDYSLRQRLAMRRLEEALACQQREREKLNFSIQCIFCRYVARGNRSKIIHHLYMIHHLNLGSPENLVFVCEYVDHLKQKLQNNECLYCENLYFDRNSLMEHMRKQNHREVNPKNNYYDKFYIINYLELGKRWLDVLAEDFEDTMLFFLDSEDEEEEESWHEWQEDNTDVDQIRGVCIFCTFNSEKIEDILNHINSFHYFDFVNYAEKENLTIYDQIKLLNFLRKQTYETPKKIVNSESDNNEIKPIVLPERSQWDNEDNLISMFSNDHFVWMFESYLEKEKLIKLNSDKENIKDGEIIDFSNCTIENDWDTINKTFTLLMQQSNNDSRKISEEIQQLIFKEYVKFSQENTVKEVTAEDWPNLYNSVLDNNEFYKLLR